jgi:hypothetical protein
VKKSILLMLVALVMVGGVFMGGQVSQATAKEAKILEFDTMVGVPRPYTRNNGNAIRGVDGGGLPWVIDTANGKLKPDGELKVKVKGLVFDPNDQGAIDAGVAGKNTIPFFKAIVSCLSKDANGNAVVINVETGLFPADEQGNSSIQDTVSLPEPCIAPIIFVTSPTSLWFAATGF